MAPKFSLQPILDYRHTRVEMIEVDLGRLVQAHQHNQAILEVFQRSQANLYEKLNQQQQGELDLLLIAQLRSNLKTVSNSIAQQKTRLQELSAQIQAKRVELISTRQEEEMLVILKAKEVERYQAAQAQQEKRLQDDIYIARAFHQPGSVT